MCWQCGNGIGDRGMICGNCKRDIGLVELWPYDCSCGYHQLNEAGDGHLNDTSGWRWGDMVAHVTDKLGIPKCGGCKQRQRALNSLGEAVHRKLS